MPVSIIQHFTVFPQSSNLTQSTECLWPEPGELGEGQRWVPGILERITSVLWWALGSKHTHTPFPIISAVVGSGL